MVIKNIRACKHLNCNHKRFGKELQLRFGAFGDNLSETIKKAKSIDKVAPDSKVTQTKQRNILQEGSQSRFHYRATFPQKTSTRRTYRRFKISFFQTST